MHIIFVIIYSCHIVIRLFIVANLEAEKHKIDERVLVITKMG